MKIIKANNAHLYGICLWNSNYLFVGCGDVESDIRKIKLINLKNGKVIKILPSYGFVTLKKLNHPKYGECLISQGFWSSPVELFLNKNKMK